MRMEARAPYVAAELRNPLCVYAYMVNDGPDYTTYFQLRCRQAIHSRVAKFRINCSSGKLSKAFHTSIATVSAVSRELCLRKAKKNHNINIMNVNKPGSDG